jgi:Asp-tRNA(Asn)/Glu-tRNA(Gln) amidotransferase A subunit family amidase
VDDAGAARARPTSTTAWPGRVGLLAGVPLGGEGQLAVAGLPLTCASKVLGGVAPRDAR